MSFNFSFRRNKELLLNGFCQRPTITTRPKNWRNPSIKITMKWTDSSRTSCTPWPTPNSTAWPCPTCTPIRTSTTLTIGASFRRWREKAFSWPNLRIVPSPKRYSFRRHLSRWARIWPWPRQWWRSFSRKSSPSTVSSTSSSGWKKWPRRRRFHPRIRAHFLLITKRHFYSGSVNAAKRWRGKRRRIWRWTLLPYFFTKIKNHCQKFIPRDLRISNLGSIFHNTYLLRAYF